MAATPGSRCRRFYNRVMVRCSDRRPILLALAFLCTVSLPVRAAVDTLDDCRAALAEGSPAHVATAPPPLLRLLSWNTMKYGREGAAAALARLGRNADLVLLQEGLRDRRGGALRHRYFADGYATSGGPSGVELRSRYAADLVCTLSFMEPWLRTPKAVLVTRHPFARAPLLVVNVHGVNFTLGVEAYGEQFGAIGELLAAHDGPAIVAGDFNNWNGRRQAVIDALAQGAGLSRARFTPDWRSRHLGVPVDGLLQRGFDVVSATAIPSRASDHHPLAVLLRPRPPAPPPSADSPAPVAR